MKSYQYICRSYMENSHVTPNAYGTTAQPLWHMQNCNLILFSNELVATNAHLTLIDINVGWDCAA